MKKGKWIFKAGILLAFIFTLMFCEYRYIMCNIAPSIKGNNTVHLEIFGNVDEYYVESENK